MSMEILRVEGLAKAFGAKQILQGIHLTLNRGERAALVGENGIGKTTLLRLLVGQAQPDSGSLRLGRGVQIGYLPQEVNAEAGLSVGRFLLGELDALQNALRQLESQLDANAPADLLQRYGDLQDAFQRGGGYEIEQRMGLVLGGLGVDYLLPSHPFDTLSGGEKTRVALAGLLLREPDLLLLDEPTNHLDHTALAWLEDYLIGYPQAVLMVSHDRHFINRVCSRILELTHAELRAYTGDYEAYLAQRDQQYQAALATYQTQREEQRRLRQLAHAQNTALHKKAPPPKDNDKTQYKFKGVRATNAIARDLRDAKQRLATLEAAPQQHPARLWHIHYDFDPLPLNSHEPLRLENLHKSYDGRVVLAGAAAVLRRGERVALVAPNGGGKTTLLRIIMGLTPPDSGAVVTMPGVRLGYLDQLQETLHLGLPVLDAFRQAASGSDQELLTQLHRGGLFTGDRIEALRVGQLSVGQRRKLALATLIAARANLLLLDEPTNHLDLPSLEALEAGLRGFAGALIAATHDRWFIEHVATQVWYLEAGQIRC